MKRLYLTPTTASAFAVALRWLGASFCLYLFPPLATAQTTPAAPPSTDEEILKLPSFVVAVTHDQGYLAANSVSATRINTPIIDLPFAMSAFNDQFIKDTAARSINDIAEYAAGVKIAGTEFNTGNTTFNVRGFGQFPQQDGVFGSVDANVYVDLAATERVEVVKGPASVLYGQILPGGTINYIPKRAGPTPATTVSISGGSYNYGRASIDINQPLIPDKLLFRFNGAWENGYQYAQPGRAGTRVFDPTATWMITKNLSLRVNYQYFEKKEAPQMAYLPSAEVSDPASIVAAFKSSTGYQSASDPLDGNIGKSISPYGSEDVDQGYYDGSNPGIVEAPWLYSDKRFNYSSAHDSRTTELGTLNTELNATIGEHWVVQGNFNYNSHSVQNNQTGYGGLFIPPPNTLVYSTGAWSVAPSWSAMTASQQLAAYGNWVTQVQEDPHAALIGEMQNGTPTPQVISRRPRLTEDFGHTDTFQLQAAGSYKFDWGTIKPLVGIYNNQSFTTTYVVRNNGTAEDPWFQTWDINPASPTYYINHDTYLSPAQMMSRRTYSLSYAGDEAAYGVLNGSFLHDRLFVVAGARYNVSRSNSTDYLATDAASAYGQGYKAHYTTPQLGVGYKITNALLLYASYSTSYTLPAGTSIFGVKYVNDQPTTVVLAQAKPTIGEGYEAGLKTNFLNGRISSTLSVYQITERDVLVTIHPIISGEVVSIGFQGVQQVSKGLEYELTYSPFNNWQIFFSFSDGTAQNTSEPVGYTYYQGEWAADFSRTMSNLWTRYGFATGSLKGLWVGGGFHARSKSQALDLTNKNAFMPSYVEVNGAVGYDWVWDHRKMTAVINWNNMTNKMVIPAEQMRALPSRVTAGLTCSF